MKLSHQILCPQIFGYIASYLKSNSKYSHNIQLFKYPGTLIDAIERRNLPDLVGFSHFIWNARLSYKFASILKNLKNDLIILFGGLNYPRTSVKQADWFKNHSFVDFHIYKEGEVAFTALIDSLIENENNLNKTKDLDLLGVHYLKKNGRFHNPEPAPRVTDLASFKSPYLSGILDKFFDGKLMPVLTTNRGCPFSCAFCSEGVNYYNKVNKFGVDRVVDEIKYIAGKIITIPSMYVRKEIYISDSNFGMYVESIKISEALKETKEKYGWPNYIIASTGKNQKERVLSVAKILDGSIKISGSVQSLDPTVLENISRKNVKAKELIQMALESTKLGANSYSEIILGLPGDSLQIHKNSLEYVINAGFDFIMPWQLVILPDTGLADDDFMKKHGLRTKFRVLSKSFGSYSFSNGEEINIAEIEKVCVTGNELSFEEYLDARLLHLVISVFYNDTFFLGLFKLFKCLDLKPFKWIEEVMQQGCTIPRINKLFNDFAEETKGELWDNYDELVDFLSNKTVINQLYDGALGANLIGKYRVMAITDCFPEVCETAKKATKRFLNDHGFKDKKYSLIQDEILFFEKECKRDIFDVGLSDTTIDVKFDIIKFLQDTKYDDLDSYFFKTPRKIRLYRNKEATEIVNRNYHIFGSSINAKYKQITRVPIKKLCRTAKYIES